MKLKIIAQVIAGPRSMVKNPNPKGRTKMVTKEYAEEWLRENKGGSGGGKKQKKEENPRLKNIPKKPKEVDKVIKELENKMDELDKKAGLSPKERGESYKIKDRNLRRQYEEEFYKLDTLENMKHRSRHRDLSDEDREKLSKIL